VLRASVAHRATSHLTPQLLATGELIRILTLLRLLKLTVITAANNGRRGHVGVAATDLLGDITSILQIVKTELHHLLEVLTVIGARELLSRDNHAGHSRNRELNILELLLIQVLVLEQHVGVIRHALVIHSSDPMLHRAALIRVHVGQLVVSSLQILPNRNHVIVAGAVVASKGDLNGHSSSRHLLWYAYYQVAAATQFFWPMLLSTRTSFHPFLHRL